MAIMAILHSWYAEEAADESTYRPRSSSRERSPADCARPELTRTYSHADETYRFSRSSGCQEVDGATRRLLELQGAEGLVGWQAREPQQASNAMLFSLEAFGPQQLV